MPARAADGNLDPSSVCRHRHGPAAWHRIRLHLIQGQQRAGAAGASREIIIAFRDEIHSKGNVLPFLKMRQAIP